MKILLWLMDNPVIATIGGLLAALGVAGWRVRRAQAVARTAELQKEAAENKAALAGVHERKRAAQEDRSKAVTLADEAHEEADAAHREADIASRTEDEATRRRQDIGKKYPAILLALALWGGSVAASCQPDADVAGLLKKLDAGGTVEHDAAVMIREYRVSREALCTEVTALRRESDTLRQEATYLRDALAAGNRVTVAAEEAARIWKRAYERAVERPAVSGRGPFGFAAGGGVCGSYDAGAVPLSLCGAVVWGWRF